MIYLKNYKNEIIKNTVLTTPEKLAIRRKIVNMEAQVIVSGVEAKFKGYSEADDVDKIKNHKIHKDTPAIYTTD